MIDTSKTVYGVAGITPKGQHLDLSYYVKTLNYQEQKGELAVRADMDIDNQKVNGLYLHSTLPLGSWIYLYSHTTEGVKETFRGRILVHEPDQDPTLHFKVTAYDPLIHLQSSKDDKYYPDGTGAQTILLDIFHSWGIPVGTVSIPNVKLGKQVFRGQQLSQMVQTVLDLVKKNGSGTYFARYTQGKVDVIAAGSNPYVYRFDLYNVSTITDQWSLEQIVTRVKIMGKEAKSGRTPVVATADGRTDFGVFQDIIYESAYNSPSAAKQAANQMIKDNGQPLKTRQLLAPDLPFLRRGDKVYVNAGTLSGNYIVSTVQHDATTHTMTFGVDDM